MLIDNAFPLAFPDSFVYYSGKWINHTGFDFCFTPLFSEIQNTPGQSVIRSDNNVMQPQWLWSMPERLISGLIFQKCLKIFHRLNPLKPRLAISASLDFTGF
ncbi:MAG: hypothetical protein GY749_02500 [Desulfobacteraceae bacterium]|nr:hypothetical protein [Desulfobacteraceae bacterium]